MHHRWRGIRVCKHAHRVLVWHRVLVERATLIVTIFHRVCRCKPSDRRPAAVCWCPNSREIVVRAPVVRAAVTATLVVLRTVAAAVGTIVVMRKRTEVLRHVALKRRVA